MDNRLKQLFAILEEAAVYERALGKMNFDMQCCAPPEGMERAGEDMAVLGQRHHKLTHSKKYRELLCSLHEEPGDATPTQRRTIELLYRNWSKTKNQSPRYVLEKERALNRSYAAWLEAKQRSDFSLFRDALADVVRYTRRDIELRDERRGSFYDICLDDHEKGGSQAQLDVFFAALKERIVPLLRRIVKEGKPIRSDFLRRPCPIGEQERFSRWLLELQGLRPTATVLMTTEHPFTTSFGPRDVRVTTHYHEEDFISNMFSTLHEGGHALLMQNEPDEFYVNHLGDRASMGIHETVSRFYENIIGRSRAFIRFIYPKLQALSPSVMEGVSEEELYEGVNIAAPSLIRIEADELSYSIHVLIRYEIEKELINGNITVDEVPALWNAKYGEYLGVEVPDDARGCLQDVHWTMDFGYFPSYALGNAYGVQILRTMEKEFDVFAAVERGELDKILTWLRERVFSAASLLDPDDWIRHITGEALNVGYYLGYLEEKFTALYGLT